MNVKFGKYSKINYITNNQFTKCSHVCKIKSSDTVIEVYGMNNLAKRIWKFRFIYLLMLPGLIGYIIFNYIPMGGVILAFKDYYVADGILKSPWVGFKYFKLIFSMSDFYKVLWNTLIINIERLIFGFPAPIILAIMIYEVSSVKFKKTVQTLVYLPHFISWVVIA